MVVAARSLPAPPELAGRWTALLEETELRPRLLELADRYPEERTLEVPFSQLEAGDTALADLLIEKPEEVLRAGERAMLELLPLGGGGVEGLRLRVTGLPATSHRTIRSIRESDLNRFLAIDGIVRKSTEVRPQIEDAVFSCLACRAEIHEPQELSATVLREPLECSACGKPVPRTRFRLLPERSTYIDA